MCLDGLRINWINFDFRGRSLDVSAMFEVTCRNAENAANWAGPIRLSSTSLKEMEAPRNVNTFG